MSRAARRGKEYSSDARVFVVSAGGYEPVQAPHSPVVVLRGGAAPGAQHPCEQWLPLARAVQAELGHKAIYIVDFGALAQEVPREQSTPGLGPVLKPLARVLTKLNPKGATLVALSSVCGLALKLLRLTHAEQLEGAVAEAVLVAPGAPPPAGGPPGAAGALPSLHLLQLSEDAAAAGRWAEAAQGCPVTSASPSRQGLSKEELIGEIASCVVARVRGRGGARLQESAAAAAVRAYELKFALSPLTKQLEQRLTELQVLGCAAAEPPGPPDAPAAAPAPGAAPARAQLPAPREPPARTPAPPPPAPAAAPAEARPRAAPSPAGPAQQEPVEPCEWWSEERDDFYAAESHMWNMRPGASLERMPVRVLALRPAAGAKQRSAPRQWHWAEVGDSHGTAWLCFRHPAHLQVLQEGAAAVVTGRVLSDPQGRLYICLPPDEPAACAPLPEDEAPVTVPPPRAALGAAARLPAAAAQRVGALLVRGSKAVLCRDPPGGGRKARLVVPSTAPRDEETPEAAAVRALCEGLDVDPDEFALAPHLGAVTHCPRPGVIEHVYFAFAIRPPPGGAQRDAEEWPLEPATSYDWFTLPHALRVLGPGRAGEQQLLREAARRLSVAAEAGLLRYQWGCGIFGVAEVRGAALGGGGEGQGGDPLAAAAAAVASMPLADGLDFLSGALRDLAARARQQQQEGPDPAPPAAAAPAPAEAAPAAPGPAAVPPHKLLPTTVLSGWLGAGKTTLLQHILHNRKGLRMAVIVNDMSEVNVDAALVEQGGAELSRTEERLVEFSNGCICCTLRQDLLEEVARLAQEGRFDYLVIESTGIGEPRPVAETFALDGLDGTSLSSVARLDTMVTVVDGPTFLREVTPGAAATLQSRGMAAGEGDERTVGQLLVDQVEFADVLLLNKCDLMTPEQRLRLRGLVRELNESAKVLETVRSEVPVEEVVGTGRFSMQRAEAHPQWMEPEHTPETEEYGISSFVYRRRRPFHPARLLELLSEGRGLGTVVRSKGYVWLATRGKQLGRWSQAGRCVAIEGGQPWWAALDPAEWPEGLRADLDRGGLWQEPHGDRQQELVVIGVGLDRSAVESALDACLLTDAEWELSPERWSELPDPLPSWDDECEDTAAAAPAAPPPPPAAEGGWSVSGGAAQKVRRVKL